MRISTYRFTIRQKFFGSFFQKRTASFLYARVIQALVVLEFNGTALVQQSLGATVKLGNPAPEFYQIASAQYATPLGLSQGNATLGNKISSACAFYDVTAGDIVEPCYAGTPDCTTDKGSTMGIGVLTAKIGGEIVPAYKAQPGYSLATGLGTVNVTNLLYNYYVSP